MKLYLAITFHALLDIISIIVSMYVKKSGPIQGSTKPTYTVDRPICQGPRSRERTCGSLLCSGDVPESSDKVAVVELPERVRVAKEGPP